MLRNCVASEVRKWWERLNTIVKESLLETAHIERHSPLKDTTEVDEVKDPKITAEMTNPMTIQMTIEQQYELPQVPVGHDLTIKIPY